MGELELDELEEIKHEMKSFFTDLSPSVGWCRGCTANRLHAPFGVSTSHRGRRRPGRAWRMARMW